MSELRNHVQISWIDRLRNTCKQSKLEPDVATAVEDAIDAIHRDSYKEDGQVNHDSPGHAPRFTEYLLTIQSAALDATDSYKEKLARAYLHPVHLSVIETIIIKSPPFIINQEKKGILTQVHNATINILEPHFQRGLVEVITPRLA